RKLQDCEPDSVEEALRSYQAASERVQSRDDSKLLLLLRVAFELPESVRPGGRQGFSPSFGGWFTDRTQINEDGTTNLAWPILWRKGSPVLVTRFQGFQGPRHDAGGEYRYFLQNYPLRRLPR